MFKLAGITEEQMRRGLDQAEADSKAAHEQLVEVRDRAEHCEQEVRRIRGALLEMLQAAEKA